MNIGIIGTGTVGSGVLEILEQSQKKFFQNGISIKVTKICVRDLTKAENLTLSKETQIVTDIDEILEDENIDCVIELIGGITTAWDIVRTALENKKHVVTANKALIAKFMPEIEILLEKNPETFFGFEASVGGGIPIIHALQRDFANDNITKISGILNGTTNFMLSKMMFEKQNYSDVLKEAQSLGFAELDPTADVGGFDARAKIAIMLRLAFGFYLDEEKIPTQGIERITQDDFQYASLLKSSIKLVAVAKKNEDKSISAFVSPAIVPRENPLAQIHGASNIVEIQSEFLQKSCLAGEGAGKYPTANAVISDVIAIAENRENKAFLPKQKVVFSNNFKTAFFIRFNISDGIGIIRKIAEVCEKNKISIDAVLQLPTENNKNMPFVLTTDPTTPAQIEKMISAIEKMDFALEKPLALPILK